MTDSALPPVDIQMAAQRLELLAQIYQSTQPQDHIVKPLPNTPSWVRDLDAKIPEVNLEHTLQLYLDCKAQSFGAAKLQGEILQGVVEKGKIADAKAQKFFGNLESQFVNAPVFYLQSLGFADVTVTAQRESYKFSAKYKNVSVEFYEFSGDASINFVSAATEIKKFIDSPNVSLSAIQVIQFADSSEDYTFTLRKKVENLAGGEAYQHTVETRYYIPMGLLLTKNYSRLEASYDKIIQTNIFPQYLAMNWGEFEYYFNRDNTIDALPKFKNAGQIVDLSTDGYLRVDERLPILLVDDIRNLKINNKPASGPVKLQYYARLFDSDAPGFSATNDKEECFENAESLTNYPTSYYRSTVSVDDVIDVFVKGLNADYDHDTNGPMKNQTAIHGLGQLRNSVRALYLLNMVAAKSEHQELRDLAKAEIQKLIFDDATSFKKVIAVFDQTKKDSALAIQTLDSLAWIYHNTNNSEIKAQIVALKDVYKINIDSNPPKYPAIVDAKTDWLNWTQAVNHFKKKIEQDNPKASQY